VLTFKNSGGNTDNAGNSPADLEGYPMSFIPPAARAALAFVLTLPAAAQGIPKAASPEEVGFVSTRLQRLSDRISAR